MKSFRTKSPKSCKSVCAVRIATYLSFSRLFELFLLPLFYLPQHLGLHDLLGLLYPPEDLGLDLLPPSLELLLHPLGHHLLDPLVGLVLDGFLLHLLLFSLPLNLSHPLDFGELLYLVPGSEGSRGGIHAQVGGDREAELGGGDGGLLDLVAVVGVGGFDVQNGGTVRVVGIGVARGGMAISMPGN